MPEEPSKIQLTRQIEGEVGQKFVSDGDHSDAMVNGLYNFAKLPGSWEDLVELPGRAVTSVVS
jgi:hypothetical protein